MSYSVAAEHARGKVAADKIFGANAAAVAAERTYGKENVVNATIGAYMDEQENLVCLPSVEETLRKLPITDLINYAPIAGLPQFLNAAIDLVFGESKPDAHIRAVATAGGSGALHHAIWNYTSAGDTVLTSDWYWNPYNVLCEDAQRKLDTYQLFDDSQNFNITAFQAKVQEYTDRQQNLLIIINDPAHNPTGYSLKGDEWDQVIAVCKAAVANPEKRIIILVDAAYLDFAGERSTVRKFLKKFSALPANLLAIVAFSMSKSYTMYGQRTGAMIGISSNEEVIQEFVDVCQFTSRATWSNINRGAMQVLANIYNDKALFARSEQERTECYNLIHKRASIFMQEAKAVSLKMLPYVAGYFLTIPAKDPDAVCAKLQEYNVFAVPLGRGVRIAVCAVTTAKITGVAAKVKKAMQEVGE